jgi:hypothetical protein
MEAESVSYGCNECNRRHGNGGAEYLVAVHSPGRMISADMTTNNVSGSSLVLHPRAQLRNPDKTRIFIRTLTYPYYQCGAP